MNGSALASGAKSANFPASSGNVTQEKWDLAFGKKKPKPGKKPAK